MLTGRRAFDAASEAELAAAILEHEPAPLAPQVPRVPPALDRVVATCLAKDSMNGGRPRGISCASCAGCGMIGRFRLRRPHVRLNAWRAAAAAARRLSIGLLLFAAISYSRQPPPASRISFSVYPPEGTRFPRGTAEMAVSPDGTRLVFVAISTDGNSRLWLRRFATSRAAYRRQRRRASPFLVTRRPLDRVLRGQQAEADSERAACRKPSVDDVRLDAEQPGAATGPSCLATSGSR
jgi:hypothetical protein